MYYRIIETEINTPDILLHIDVNIDGNLIVEIKAFGTNKEGVEDFIVQESIVFDCIETAKDFIKDYSIKSAIKWILKQELTYSS